MRLAKLTTIGAVMMSLATFAFAGTPNHHSPHRLKREVERVQYRIDGLEFDILNLEDDLGALECEIEHREEEKRRARCGLTAAEQALVKLRTDAENAPALVERAIADIETIETVQIPALEEEARMREGEYHSISGGFFKRLRKLRAKSRWNAKLREINNRRAAIKQLESRILYLHNLVADYTTFENAALENIDNALYRVEILEDKRPRISSLVADHRVVQRELRFLRRELMEEKSRLSNLESRLAGCPADEPVGHHEGARLKSAHPHRMKKPVEPCGH
jgi:chromosome segregation ATPase